MKLRPAQPKNTVDLYFMDARSKLIDIAAFMDRIERDGMESDFRYQAFRAALEQLQRTPRAENVLRSLSDPSLDLIPTATTKAACGAPLPKV